MPGVPVMEDATTALLRAVRRLTDTRVFVMGAGATATAVWAAQQDAAVTYWTESLAEATTLTATFTANGLPAPQLFCQDDFANLPVASCDLALLHLPRGRALQQEAWRVVAALLRPGGRLAFVGAKNEGVRSACDAAQTIFGQVGIVVRKGGYHAGLAQRPRTGDFPLPSVIYTEHAVAVDGVPTRLFGTAGVFAGDRLDAGAAALIAGMEVATGEQVLELGCGTGVVTLVAQRRSARATAVDVSARAVAATQHTLAANGYPDTPVLHSHGADAVREQLFDVVVTNPPFHQGHGVDFEVAQGFIADAARVLRTGGRLYLVANTFLKYAPRIERHFSKVAPVWKNGRFTVWKGLR